MYYPAYNKKIQAVVSPSVRQINVSNRNPVYKYWILVRFNEMGDRQRIFDLYQVRQQCSLKMQSSNTVHKLYNVYSHTSFTSFTQFQPQMSQSIKYSWMFVCMNKQLLWAYTGDQNRGLTLLSLCPQVTNTVCL